jgi:hypothetical protein
MNGKWGWLARLGTMVLFVVVGCRSTQPELKPGKQPEVFNAPSEHANLASYPKQAFNNGDDASKRATMDPTSFGKGPGMQPASFGGPTPGMPGGGLR